MAKRHYYRLEGESLDALNMLIRYDKLMADFRKTDLRKNAAKITGKEGPEENPQTLSLELSTHFTAAQLKEGYREKLGFGAPPVTIRKYGSDGVLYRAYHKFPQIAMNPGTSKAYFGLGDMFKKSDRTAENRLAIYISYEDYKGNYFVPPEAVELTEQEFSAFAPDEESFEYYRTYDEGTPLPADFNPATDQISYTLPDEFINFTHAFLVQGETHEKLVAYDKAVYDWPMPHQDFRDKYLPGWMKMILGDNAPRLLGVIEEPEKKGQPRAIRFVHMTQEIWDKVKDNLLLEFRLKKIIPGKRDEFEVLLVPRQNRFCGLGVKMAMDKVPPYPKKPVDFGFEERPTLENTVVFDGTMSGFPYMQIERYEDGNVKLLAFRLPPNIKTVDAPESCTSLSLDDYRALSGRETDLPTHVFRIEGEAYRLLSDFDNATNEYVTRGEIFKNSVVNILQATVPGLEIGEFKLTSWKSDAPRRLEIHVKDTDYQELKPVLEDHFKIDYASQGCGHIGNTTVISLESQTETENGKHMAQTMDSVPYEPYFSRELDRFFGFNWNQGYDHMKVEKLDGLKQHAVLYKFPPYIKDAAPPPDCVPLTKEEYALIWAESADVRAGSPPAPRPDHLKHLPVPDGLQSYEHLLKLKERKDNDGLPLHERTEHGWFKIRR